MTELKVPVYHQRGRGHLALGVAILVLLLSGIASYRALVEFRDSDKWVRHTHEVLQAVNNLTIALERLQSSARGYIITGDEAYAQRCRANAASAEQDEASITRLTGDNAMQQARLPDIRALVSRQIQFEDMVIQIRRTSDLQAAAGPMRLGTGEAIMSEFQSKVLAFTGDEQSLLALRDKKSRRRLAEAMTLLVLGTLLGLSTALAAGWAVRREDGRGDAAEEALRSSEEQYRMLLDGIHDHAIYMLDPEGRVLNWNDGAQRIKGYTAEEIVGQNYSCFFTPEDIALGKPEEVLRLSAERGHHKELGFRVRKDGSQFPSEINLTALRSPSGTLRGFVKITLNLTESSDSAVRYRRLLEATPEAILVINPAGEILQLNVFAEKQFGYAHDELVGQSIETILPDAATGPLFPPNAARQAVGAASGDPEITGQMISSTEFCATRKDGTEFPAEATLSPLESAGRSLLAIRDISPRRRTEALLLEKLKELKRSNEELEKFAYIASHDLQEPLRMVASYTQLLSRRYKGRLDADADEFIAFAVDGAARMQGLIQDLLAYSRVGTQGKELSRTSAEDMFTRALFNLRGAIEETGAIVTHDPLPTVLADPNQLVQLFQNLIGNAIKYQDKSADIPQIHVSAERNGRKRWTFSVKDNGIGISPQYFERIFGMFQRLHKREEFAGTGIGLAICKKIAERHGGSISVESQPGHGSTFHFALAGE